YQEGVEVAKEALEVAEDTFGLDHPHVAQSLENYASLLRKTNRVAEAAEMEGRAKRIRAGQHSKTASSTSSAQEARWKALYDQSMELYQQGKYREAIPVVKESLKVAEQTFGSNNLYVATSLNNLGELYRAQGRYAEAEPFHKRALAIREKALGPDHPTVTVSLNNLAIVYQAQGRYGQAEPLHKRALAIQEKAFGPNHPDVAQSLNNLAMLYYEQGRYA
ncbi:MAG: tetratricopeptide repeat protein, partial [bacterium]|nr:tetratricopeptide repeat protein [bacterium]